jgi:16S rRNA (adenine1518-N6/adenine1519-N6)-dimethyltransferase
LFLKFFSLDYGILMYAFRFTCHYYFTFAVKLYQLIRAKKHFGQHFLKEKSIADKICMSLGDSDFNAVVEVGPGQGILTSCLLERFGKKLFVVEIDPDMVQILEQKFPALKEKIILDSFLEVNLISVIPSPFAVIGNFPYNISSQILFRVIENREFVTEMIGMFQKEVAQRIASGKGTKDYGILSVIVQAFYDVKYLFSVSEGSFNPPPKVKSGVIKLIRKENFHLPCDENLFFKVVKQAFNQRRKTLRNALSSFGEDLQKISPDLLSLRAEQLDVEDYIHLTKKIED